MTTIRNMTKATRNAIILAILRPGCAFLPADLWQTTPGSPHAAPLSLLPITHVSTRTVLQLSGQFDDRVPTVALTENSSMPSTATTTTLDPNRPIKRRKRKKKRKSSPAMSIASEADLAEHVSQLYIYGPGGILRDKSTATFCEAQHYLKQLDRHPALVLNADYQPISYLPLSMWHWQEAIKAVFSGKVTVVDVYEHVNIRAANLAVPLPSVIALNEYVPNFCQKPAFTKRNVFLRDEYRCQYCSDTFHTKDLSLDHVVPRSRGGSLHWENAVTCCRRCNGRKGSLSVRELRQVGMQLNREPRVPSQYELAAIASRMLPRQVHPTWEPYLGMDSTVMAKVEGRKAKQKALRENEAVMDP